MIYKDKKNDDIKLNKKNMTVLNNKMREKFKIENEIIFRDYGPLENAPNI